MDLDAYRTQAEQFLAEQGEEYHAHFAGLKETFELEPIYARHADLFSAETVARLREQAGAAGARGEDAARRARMLLDFAVEGHMGLVSTDLEEQLAEREAGIRLSIDGTGEAIGYREAAIVQANEPDRARRAAIEAARLEATETHLNPLHREALERTRATTRELGWPSYRALCAELKGFDLDRLARATAAFTAATEEPFDALIGPVVERTLGLQPADLARADLPRLFRFEEADAAFSGEALLPSFEATLDGLGIDPRTQPNVLLDVESRPGKSPRAFCVPVRVPQDVRLVLPPVGGRDDFVALLHEGGHVQHFAHVDPQLAFEYRHLGDNAVTEAFAFLFDHLAEDPSWLRARLGVEDADGALAAHARATRLIYLRRYAAKLAYELDVHDERAPDDAALRARYASLLGAGARVRWPRETYLADLDPGFYVAAYLRAWALETHLRAHLRERFGAQWFAQREAGDALRALWRDGQRLSAEELLGELTGAELDFGALLVDLGLVDADAGAGRWTGGCLCGAVRFELRGACFTAGYCHCRRCQGRTGTGSSLNGLAHGRDLHVVAGAASVRTWQPPDGFPKSFCGECGAHLYSGVPGGDGVVGVRFGALDGDPGIAPRWRQWTASAPTWERIPDDGLPRYAEAIPAELRRPGS